MLSKVDPTNMSEHFSSFVLSDVLFEHENKMLINVAMMIFFIFEILSVGFCPAGYL